MKKVLCFLLSFVICCLLCGCATKENLFSESNSQKLTMGNISFRIPNSAVDDYNPDFWLIQQFEVDGIGNIYVAQLNKNSESEYYQSYEDDYELYETLADISDNVTLFTTLNGKNCDKGYRSITINNERTAGYLCAFADDNCYYVMLEADNKTFSEENFNNFVDTIEIQ